MKFTWKIELESGRILEYDLSPRELALLEQGVITFHDVIERIDRDIKEEDAL